ncbi:MAG: hypothetical protein WBA39_00090 [Rivularia sp. (in: cyanobacteria)]
MSNLDQVIDDAMADGYISDEEFERIAQAMKDHYGNFNVMSGGHSSFQMPVMMSFMAQTEQELPQEFKTKNNSVKESLRELTNDDEQIIQKEAEKRVKNQTSTEDLVKALNEQRNKTQDRAKKIINQHFDHAVEMVKKYPKQGSAIVDAVKAISDFILGALETIGKFIDNLVDKIVEWVEEAYEKISNFFKAVVQKVEAFFVEYI